MSVFTTHDLPTLRGWWHGGDIDLRETLGVFDESRATPAVETVSGSAPPPSG